MSKKIFFLLFVGSFILRWIKIPEFLFFGYEQGRDAEVIKNIYTFTDFTLVGPKTDFGGIFHGPLYYYLMALPYKLSGGNPVVGTLFLSLISSLVPVVVYLLFKDLFRSKAWGLAAGVMAVFSFELISYARWLSNVNLAVLFVALAFYFLWKYCSLHKQKYFYFSVICAGVAAQFEIILGLEFMFAYFFLWIFRIIQPTLKMFFLSFILTLVVFAPLILFDFRHDHITANSILSILLNIFSGSKDFFILNTFTAAHIKFLDVLGRTLVNQKSPLLAYAVLAMIIAGLYRYAKKMKFDPDNRRGLIFLLVWGFMPASIFWLGGGLDQAYVGSGIAWIGLFLISVKGLWQGRFRAVALVLSFIVVFGWAKGLMNVYANKDIFFVTIQDDLNLADQRKVLKYIHDDSSGQGARIEAFTIPSLHPEGWKYLQSFYYPNDRSADSKLVYIIIESQVYPVWEERWIKDLGDTKLVDERLFGKIRVQKRLL